MREVNLIILHCSASDLPNQDVEMIRQWHLLRGFVDIGYHWLLKTDGTIQQGRPEEEVGAHVAGHNHDSIGICLVGLHNFTRAQFASLRQLLMPMKRRYPNATLHGHHEYTNIKECPVYDYDEFVEFWKNLSPAGEPMEEKS